MINNDLQNIPKKTKDTEQHEHQSLNSDGQQYHQYQENEQSFLTLNH